ncbi:hypothetical protein NPIL_410481 [Nephila pilipes]|uniref:Uncharacterized protein n=1 Tax=Nephila pilipes TaxID=299642 RepID=A0A8X6PPF0_NEPPI|nr:hypothetical protein NPIL_410481 [Nephila pilipes]
MQDKKKLIYPIDVVIGEGGNSSNCSLHQNSSIERYAWVKKMETLSCEIISLKNVYCNNSIKCGSAPDVHYSRRHDSSTCSLTPIHFPPAAALMCAEKILSLLEAKGEGSDDFN